MNKGNLIQNGKGNQGREGGFSLRYHSWQFTVHTSAGRSLLHIPQQEGRYSSCLATDQPMRHCHNLEFLLSLMNLVQNNPSQPLPFFFKIVFFFLLHTCLWFTIVSTPLLFLNKLNFAGYTAYLFLLMIDNSLEREVNFVIMSIILPINLLIEYISVVNLKKICNV